MRAIGFEWLYRLFKQPQRIGRIFRAVIVFPLAVLFFQK
jgi:UDP-N-acetyl-D-mannosaminuronic acid transferase (WecB/TagA/CpsF family)